MNLYGTLYIRKSYLNAWLDMHLRSKAKIINHEMIHEAQALDYCSIKWIGYTIFYIIYFYHWLKLIILPPYDTAYKDIPFEVEASGYSNLLDYLQTRIRKAWKYMK